MPSPNLSAEGKRAVGAWLDAEVAKGTHPAIFAAIATADEMLYFNAKGDRVFAQPEKGQVDEDTGEWWARWPRRLSSQLASDICLPTTKGQGR